LGRRAVAETKTKQTPHKSGNKVGNGMRHLRLVVADADKNCRTRVTHAGGAENTWAGWQAARLTNFLVQARRCSSTDRDISASHGDGQPIL
jgi:hypothetical protein